MLSALLSGLIQFLRWFFPLEERKPNVCQQTEQLTSIKKTPLITWRICRRCKSFLSSTILKSSMKRKKERRKRSSKRRKLKKYRSKRSLSQCSVSNTRYLSNCRTFETSELVTQSQRANHSVTVTDRNAVRPSWTRLQRQLSACDSPPVLSESESDSDEDDFEVENVYETFIPYFDEEEEQCEIKDFTNNAYMDLTEGEKTWFEQSEEHFVHETPDANVPEIKFDDFNDSTPRTWKGFYKNLIKNPEHLRDLLNKNPSKYKRCRLQIETAHRSIAKVLDKDCPFSEILINGRTKCGQTYNDDEVVVEVLQNPENQLDSYGAVKMSQQNNTISAHGEVVGLLQRVRYADNEHPILLCCMDENEGHLMKPLCKTVPKIHVLNETVKKRYPAMTKHKIEVNKISSDGEVVFKRFINVKLDRKEQYVFKVILLTWRLHNIYPLGAVLEAYNVGKSYNGGLLVLRMRYNLPGEYPRDVVNHTKFILQEAKSVLHVELSNNMNRKDLTTEEIFTIYSPTATDLDDAFNIWKKTDRFVVGVHVADVAEWVGNGTALDQEARKRGVTFYLPDHKPHTMLPEPLNQDVCSLLPNKKRLALSIFFTFDMNYNLMEDVEPDVYKTIIMSRRQFAFNEVQDIIEEDPLYGTSNPLCEDIRQLYKIAARLCNARKETSSFFVPFEDPRLYDLDEDHNNIKAHTLVEEFMILTNAYIAKRLRSKFPRLMILRCQESPAQEKLTQWKEKEGVVSNLVMQLQGKKISSGCIISVDNINRNSSVETQSQPVILQAAVWERLHKALKLKNFEKARQLVFQDALHPLQYIANKHWMELMETAVYKCSCDLIQPDHFHFGLNQPIYTHFTSPLRRYGDIYVHRLLHADLEGKSPHFTTDDVTELCAHINSITATHKAFKRSCLSLKTAVRLNRQPLVFSTYVDRVSKNKVSVRVPSLLTKSDRKQDLYFRAMGVSSITDLKTDTMLKRDNVSVTWKTRIFNVGKGEYKQTLSKPYTKNNIVTENEKYTVDINAHHHSVLVKVLDWLDILHVLKESNSDQMRNIPTPIDKDKSKIDYVYFDKKDGSLHCRLYAFRLNFFPGQVLKVLMTSETNKGVLKPRVQMLQTARNVYVCLKHVTDPVSAFYHFTTRATRLQRFTCYNDYLKAWIPLLETEAVNEAGSRGNTVLIENVQVVIQHQSSSQSCDRHFYTGTFNISSRFCFEHCIDFTDFSVKDTLKRSKDSYPVSLSYLCIRHHAKSKGVKSLHPKQSLVPFDDGCIWVGHASVMTVKHENKHNNDDGELSVFFILSDKSPQPPLQLMSEKGDSVTIEILPKQEVERRAQVTLLYLENNGCALARAIAYGEKTPLLDSKRIERGRNAVYQEDETPEIQKLHSNNESQKRAITMALTQSISLIQGPPGTGKTNTAIKLVYHFCKINRELEEEGKGKTIVLYCGPSNKCVDLVADRMRKKLGTACLKIIRMYGSVIETMDYPVPRGSFTTNRGARNLKSDVKLRDITLHHLIRESSNPYAEKIKCFDSYFTKCRDNPKCIRVTRKQLRDYREFLRLASIEEFKQCDVVLTTCAVGGSTRLNQGTEKMIFQVIIDECAMSPEPHTLIPIIANKAKQVVLIGDHKQLRPIIKCKHAAELGLNQSLFERLIQESSIRSTFLDTQYRMHSRICEFPSDEFYDGNLKTGESVSVGVILWPFWPKDGSNKEIPHIMLDVHGEETSLTVSSEEGNERSFSNSEEANIVMEIVKYLITLDDKNPKYTLNKNSIKILTQYNAQRNMLETKRKELYKHQNYSCVCEVSTVVSSQGGEWDYVILSTVRSIKPYKIEQTPTRGWCRQHLGFITDWNQVNVALTRPRKGLIIVGNKSLLECDEMWKRLVQRYERMKCIYSAEEFQSKFLS